MSKLFFDALDDMRKDSVDENPLFDGAISRIYTDVAELAARMGVEANSVKQDPQAWGGQGLPPVGCECEIAPTDEYFKHDKPAGHQVKIYSNFVDDRGCEMAAFVDKKGRLGGVGVARMFRSLRTEREKAIDAAVDIMIGPAPFGGEPGYMRQDSAKQAAALYDAGFLQRPGPATP